MSPKPDFLKQADLRAKQLTAWRRDFHCYPELAFEEQRSASIIAGLLESWGYEVHTGIAQTGILARLGGHGKAPGVLLRVDMDALPIQEQSDAEYASRNPGVMHACGHDGHMAIGLGVADLLRDLTGQLEGDVYLIFQPAEEGGGGAQRMIEERVLDGLDVGMALGVHLWNEKPLGWFGVTSGPTMAGAERFQMHVRGLGGHGGMPNLTRDPVVASASIITGIQTILARTVDPIDSAVLSVTHIEAGSNFNVIPAEVFLEGTIRTLRKSTRFELIERFEKSARQIAQAHECEIELIIDQVAPPVVNEPNHASYVREVVRHLYPDGQLEADHRVMVSEDMAYFLKEIPGVFIFVGSANAARGLVASHHTSDFDFDERALVNAVALLSSVIGEKLHMYD